MKVKDTDTRTHILDTGRRLTALRGYTAVGLGELLKVAGVPKGSFYHYFPSKEAYGCALLDTFVSEYDDKLAATLKRNDLNARQRMLSYFEGWKIRQLSPDPEHRCLVVKLAAEIADLSEDMSEILNTGVNKIIEVLSETLQQGVADGSITPVDDCRLTAATIYHLWLGASLVASLSHDDAPLLSAMQATEKLIPEA